MSSRDRSRRRSTEHDRPAVPPPGAAGRVVGYTVLVVGAVLALAPLVLSVLVSFTSRSQFARTGGVSIPRPATLDNYVELLGRADFLHAVVVTAAMVTLVVVVQVSSSALAAYAFARLRFPGRGLLFALVLATMMVPGIVTLVPLYLLFTAVGLRDTFAGLVLPSLLISPYAVFLLRQHFLRLPGELIQAAQIDGAGHLRVLWHIVLPLSRPVLLTLAVITAVSHWNSFLWPLMIAGTGKVQVLTVATANLQTQYDNQWTLVTAATTLSILPLLLLYLVFQRQIVGSLAIRGIS